MISTYAFLKATGIAVGLISTIILFPFDKLKHTSAKKDRDMWLGFMLAQVTNYLFVIWLFATSKIERLLEHQIPPRDIRTGIGGGAILASALLLFLLKIKRPGTYAAIEIMGGVAIGYKTIRDLGEFVQPIELLSLLGAIYLIVRGLDNLRNGSAKFAEHVKDFMSMEWVRELGPNGQKSKK